MIRFALAAAAVLGCAVVGPSPAAAAPNQSVAGFSVDRLAELMRDAGFSAEVVRRADGAYVLGRKEEARFQAIPGGCDAQGDNCVDVELYAGFSGAPKIEFARLNAWNARTRFARAFIQETGEPGLQMDISVDGGVNAAALRTQFAIWDEALATFTRYLLADRPAR